MFAYIIAVISVYHTYGSVVPIQFTNITNVTEFSELLPAGLTYVSNGDIYVTYYNDYNDETNKNYYYVTGTSTTMSGGVYSDIYDNNLKQYNNTKNIVLSNDLPFTISKYNTSTSICTSSISKNIIQCFDTQCRIWMNQQNEWIYTQDIPRSVKVHCLNDDTFLFIYYADYHQNTLNYTLLSHNGQYIVKSKPFYKFPFAFSSYRDIIFGNFTINDISDEITNTFILVFTVSIDQNVIIKSDKLYAINGYYSNSTQTLQILQKSAIEIDSIFGNDFVGAYVYKPITANFTDDCCYILSYSMLHDDMQSNYQKVAILNAKTKIVGSFKTPIIRSQWSSFGYIAPANLIELTMLNTDNNNNTKYFVNIVGNQDSSFTQPSLCAYLFEIKNLENGNYIGHSVNTSDNKPYIILGVQNENDTSGLYNYYYDVYGYIAPNSNSILISWWTDVQDEVQGKHQIPTGQIFNVSLNV